MSSALRRSEFDYRVLIVEDNDRDWALPMKEALEFAADAAGLLRIHVDVANDGESARQHLARENYHVVSLDMLFPERKGEIISVETGLKLASEFTALDFPKYLIYSQLLNEPRTVDGGTSSDAVLALRYDTYGKPTGATQPQQQQVTMLSVDAWANRVIDYLDPTRLQLEADPGDTVGKLTVLGAQLKRGPSLLPPTLARAVALLTENGLEGVGSEANLAAVVRETTRWAIAQSALLCAADGQPLAWPADATLQGGLQALRAMQPGIQKWNWSRYCNMAALDAFESFTALPSAAAGHLALRYSLDLGAFWVRHPLYADLRHSRDGWTAQPLRGPTLPRRRELLTIAHDFGGGADSRSAWQGVWSIGSDRAEPARHRLIDWSAVLQRDDDDKRWWLNLHSESPEAGVWLEIDSGVKMIRPYGDRRP